MDKGKDITLAKAVEELEHMLQIAVHNLYLAGRHGDAELIFAYSLTQNILVQRLSGIIGSAKTSKIVGRAFADINGLYE